MAENFLLANPENRVKKQVENIYQSYSHPWDVLAELTQNSVDAIKDWESEFPNETRQHKITLKINKESRSVIINDTGIGIIPDKLPDLLAPNATDKAGDSITVGEKGVGLTFCIFCSNKFNIETKSPLGEYSADLVSARTWRQRDEVDDIPDTQNESRTEEPISAGETGTKIRLDDIQLATDEEESIFELSPERLKYLLRTKTAVGNTKVGHSTELPDIDIHLEIVSESETEFDDDLDFMYYYPDQFWESEDVVDLEKFENRDDIGRMSDGQKREHLDGKVWKASGETTRNGNEIRYYAVFLPSSKGWERVSRQNDLIDNKENNDVKSGIYISTRGMPTGIEINAPDTGSRGYWNNMYILLGYDGFQFDLGRKSIPGRTQGMLKDIAIDKFNLFTNWRNAIRSSSKNPSTKPTQVVRTQRQERFEKLDRIADLNYPSINFGKLPDSQEAGVVAMFHELIGANELDNYICYRSGYSQDYDFWGRYEAAIDELGENIQSEFPDRDMIKQNVVLEAKYEASDVIRDIEEDRKYLSDIDMIVCWKVDEEKFNESSVTIEPLSDEDRFFVGSTHKAIPANSGGPIGPQLYILSIERYMNENRPN